MVTMRSRRLPFRRRRFKRRATAFKQHRAFIPTGHYVDRQYHDQSFTNAFSNTVAYGHCNILPYLPGTPAGQRATERVIMRGIQWNFTLQGGTAQGNLQTVRIMLVYDKQTNGADPASPLPLTGVSPYSFKDNGYRERFTIIRDWTLQVGPANAANYQNNYQGDKHGLVQTGYAKVSLPVQFNNGVAGTIADIATGSLLLFLVGDTAVTANNTPQFAGNIRVIYSQLGRH